jgi:hypothetical protein
LVINLPRDEIPLHSVDQPTSEAASLAGASRLRFPCSAKIAPGVDASGDQLPSGTTNGPSNSWPPPRLTRSVAESMSPTLK